MIRINQVKLKVGHSSEELEKKLVRELRIRPEELEYYQIRRRSLDARKKPELYFVYMIDVKVVKESRVLKKNRNHNIQRTEETRYQLPRAGKKLSARPIVVGSGPAGLFCAYILAQAGVKPVLLERGASVEERQREVEAFWRTGKLDTGTNVQFGEGGAGTFSDGKLNTLVKDTKGRNRFVLETFVRFGAPEEILYEQKPHIGTDILIRVVKNIREEICRLGGEVRFHSKMTDLLFEPIPVSSRSGEAEGKAAAIKGVVVNGTELVKTDTVVLAVGHSARDTFEMLCEKGICMQAKSFAVGVRVEHRQEMINQSQYGCAYPDGLSAASYKLTGKLQNGRGVYSFCMCPGGYVVNASSEEGRLAVNGMSYHARDGENANSAIIVTVTPEDFKDSGPLAGMEFQRKLEEKAYQAGRGKIPVQRYEDFCGNRISKEFGKVLPQTKGETAFGDVRGIFPEEIAQSLQEGIAGFESKIQGFADKDAILSGVESRTSSPIRILRDQNLEGEISGFYPCGEGAGFAGGITSAAMDGMKVAEQILK